MSSASAQPASGFSVAVVDDDPRLRQLLALELEDLGVGAACFSSASELLQWERLHELKLILLDLVMPDMDGLTCLIQLRQACFRGMVVVVTANWETNREPALLQAGADDCWNKTEALERLAPLMRHMRLESLSG